MDIKPSDRTQYFAALPTKECVAQCEARVESWGAYAMSNDYLYKVRKSWYYYHGNFTGMGSGHRLTSAGDQGELVRFPVNHYRNIADHLLNLTTSSRPAMEARANNTDYKSLTQTILANGLLDYYMREKGLEEYLIKAVTYAIVFGEGYVKLGWNTTAGKLLDADEETDEKYFEGDLEFSNLSPFDVFRDHSKENSTSHDWLIVRSYKNRFDLVAKYPELKDEIEGIQSKSDLDNIKMPTFSSVDTDDIPVYELYQRSSEAMPEGRYVVYSSQEVVYYDGPLPYDEIPIYRMSPADILGTPYGYTTLFDLMPVQEAINLLYSTIITNQNAFGVQNIQIPKNADITFSQLAGGLNIIETNPGTQITPLNLTQTPAEIFKMLQQLEQTMETLSGINSVTRGQPEASLKSGAALALIQAQAVQFANKLQQSYVRLVENTGTAMIKVLKRYAKEPRVAAVAGIANRGKMVEFSSEDLAGIDRVSVEIANPLSKCLKKDTPILMYDGTIKMVQHIKTGDLVMGPDSMPRTVESVSTGIEEMFDIHASSKDNEFLYGCNESHILSLTYCAKRTWKGYKKGDKVDISVGEFLKWPKSAQRLFMGYRTGVDFAEQVLDFPAYQLGLWLGDGHADRLTITTQDTELSDSWKMAANDLSFNTYKWDQSATVHQIGFSKTEGKYHKSILTSLGVYKNKHIPNKYLINSRKNRLELLAGLLDTDGTLVDQTFVISQKSDEITKGIIFLSRSLGFKTVFKKFKATCQNGVVGEYNKVTIGGNTWEIPTKLKRKQANKVIKHRNFLNYGITIKSIGVGTYYGFTLKEEPHFLLSDFTVTHNTTAGRLEIANQLLQMNLIKNVDDYFTVLNTGKLDTMIEGIQAQVLLIRSENEAMMDGKLVQAIAFDNHREHINEHQSLLADPQLREDPTLVKVVLEHIQQHINLLSDPSASTVLAVTNQQPLPPQQGSDQGSQPNGQPPGEPGRPAAPGPGPGSPGGPMQQPPSGAEAAQAQSNAQIPHPPAPFQDMPLTAQAAMAQNASSK